MRSLTDDEYFALVNAKSVEEFLMTKDLFGLDGKFDEENSREIATTFVVNHKDSIAYALDECELLTIGHKFASRNHFESIGRQRYINNGMERFISRHYARK